MKKVLEFDGVKYLYEVISYDCGEYGAYTGYETVFYSFEPKITVRKKYFLFGEDVEIKENKKLFTIHAFNIKDPKLSKKEVYKELKKYIIEEKRKKEIEKGDIL